LPGCWVVIRLDGKGFTKCVPQTSSGIPTATQPVWNAVCHHSLRSVSFQCLKSCCWPCCSCMAPQQQLLNHSCPCHRFCNAHGFEKPNDKRGLDLMDAAAKVNPAPVHTAACSTPCCACFRALTTHTKKPGCSELLLLPQQTTCATCAVHVQEVMTTFPDIRLGYGESDEYSFVLHKGTRLYGEQQASHHVQTRCCCLGPTCSVSIALVQPLCPSLHLH
jgi:hypothetical protein